MLRHTFHNPTHELTEVSFGCLIIPSPQVWIRHWKWFMFWYILKYIITANHKIFFLQLLWDGLRPAYESQILQLWYNVHAIGHFGVPLIKYAHWDCGPSDNLILFFFFKGIFLYVYKSIKYNIEVTFSQHPGIHQNVFTLSLMFILFCPAVH